MQKCNMWCIGLNIFKILFVILKNELKEKSKKDKYNLINNNKNKYSN